MSYSAETSYAPEPGTPRHARVWTLGCIRDALPDTFVHLLLDDVAVVVSELVTYAMQWSAGSVVVAVDVRDATIRVAVRYAATPTASRAFDPLALSSESALHLVAALASDWGTDTVDAERTELWAELSLVQARAM